MWNGEDQGEMETDGTDEIEEPINAPGGIMIMSLCGCTQCEQDSDPQYKRKRKDWTAEELEKFWPCYNAGLKDIANPQHKLLRLSTLTQGMRDLLFKCHKETGRAMKSVLVSHVTPP